MTSLYSLRQKPFYRPVIWIFFLFCFALSLRWLLNSVMDPGWYSIDDFVGYWAASHLNAYGGNPYSPTEIQTLQNNTFHNYNDPLMMWNPPWTLALTFLFGLFDYPFGRSLWMLVNIGLLGVGVNVLWRMYGGSKKIQWMSWLIGFTFIPVLDALKKGQVGIILLIGVVGFLYFTNLKKYFLAGLFVVLFLIKPHIMYLPLIAILFWAIQKSKWSLLLGGFVSVLIASIIIWIINPNIINQYLVAVTQISPPRDWATPTIGGILRWIFGFEKFWLQFFPPILGCIWLSYYWLRNYASWNWLEQTPLLILVSITTAAYGWTFDQVVALVAITQIACLILWYKNKKNPHLILIIGSYLLIDSLLIIINVNELFYWWLAPSLLIWYILSIRYLNTGMKTILSDIAT